jgi:hypothetical protein
MQSMCQLSQAYQQLADTRGAVEIKEDNRAKQNGTSAIRQ